jgi:hypothetical protein
VANRHPSPDDEGVEEVLAGAVPLLLLLLLLLMAA